MRRSLDLAGGVIVLGGFVALAGLFWFVVWAAYEVMVAKW